ncbi:MAG: aminoacyl-tRNA hydrolase [Pseudomonadota bacterium]
MLIIAGLGNPGQKYAGNRHNIGFMTADEIVRRHAFGAWKSKFNAEISSGTLDGEKALVIKPQTFMNESGQAVGEALRFYKESLSNLIVVYDELDLAPGKLRIKTGGGSGGHNGIKSIDAHCGKDYRRMRLGIGHPGSKEKVLNYVIGDFAKADQQWLDELLRSIAENAPLLTTGEDAKFMNRVALETGQNQDKQKPKPKAQSHIHQARNTAVKVETPKSGPMADMLKKLFGDRDKDT